MKPVLVDLEKNTSIAMDKPNNSPVSVMQVAVGIICDDAGNILISQRPQHTYKGGLWEFPGGKIEAHEDVFQALQRELHEELGIQVLAAESWLQFEYDYKDRVVCLHTWRVTQFLGEPHGREGQVVRWVRVDELDGFQFPDGNVVILENLKSLKA